MDFEDNRPEAQFMGPYAGKYFGSLAMVLVLKNLHTSASSLQMHPMRMFYSRVKCSKSKEHVLSLVIWLNSRSLILWVRILWLVLMRNFMMN